MEQNDYYVVFEYTKEAGMYAGNRFRISFRDKDHLQKSNYPQDKRVKIIKEDISDEESLQLCEKVPFHKQMNAAIKNASDEKGNIDGNLSNFELGIVLDGSENPKKHIEDILSN